MARSPDVEPLPAGRLRLSSTYSLLGSLSLAGAASRSTPSARTRLAALQPCYCFAGLRLLGLASLRLFFLAVRTPLTCRTEGMVNV